MILGGFQKLTLIDFPGKIAATVFTSGCSLRCPFCYNSELVLAEKIKEHPKIPEKEFFDFLMERKGMLEGICVTGGEPTLQNDLSDFAERIKKMGFSVKLDTNGTNPEMIKDLVKEKLIDYVAMDIKAPLGAKVQSYDEVTGTKADLSKIKESIDIIKNSGLDYEFRTTVVPVFHKKEDIIQIAKEISPSRAYFLQNFRPEKTLDQELQNIKPYPLEYLLEIQKTIAPFFEICQVR